MAALRPSDGLLEQVAAYTAEAVSAVTLEDLSAPTPCTQWNLLALMLHLNTSLGTLIETLQDGRPDLIGMLRRAAGTPSHTADLLGADDDVGTLLATAVRYRTERLVRVADTLRQGDGPNIVLVDGRPLPCDLVAAAGAVEIAVHSWDIATACGRTLPIPDAPAVELLGLSALIVDGAGRSGLFASAVSVPSHAGPGDRLIALLGRTPH
jgi:uncharacterized protein (TIGR03086 family)